MQTLIVVFIVVWIGVALIWIALDWLGSIDRGKFRPAGHKIPWRPSLARKARRKRKEREAEMIRAELDHAFGRTTLRILSGHRVREEDYDQFDLDEFDDEDDQPDLIEFEDNDFEDNDFEGNDYDDDFEDNDYDDDHSPVDPDEFAAEFSPSGRSKPESAGSDGSDSDEPDMMQRARTLWKQMAERDR